MAKPTIESLTKRLQQQQTRLDAERKAYQAAQEALMKTHKNVEDLQGQIANLKYKEVEPAQIDWKDLLMANSGQGRYNLMHQKWHELWPHGGIRPENYIPETGQYTLCFHLDKKTCTDEYLKDMVTVLNFIMPFLIPHEDVIHFSITEPGLSEFTSYDIKYDPNTQIWSLREGRSRKKESFGSNDTLTFLKYLAARHSFDYSGDHEEDED
jgi:hypothetical protein